MNMLKNVIMMLVLILVPGVQITNAFTENAQMKYRDAEKKEARLFKRANSITEKKILIIAELYRDTYTKFPQSKAADDALFHEARLYEKLYRIFLNEKYFNNAIDLYKNLVSQYPGSSWADDSIYFTALLLWEKREIESALNYLTEVQKLYPNSDGAKEAAALTKKIKIKESEGNKTKENKANVKSIRHWTGKRYTRVVIDITKAIKYNYGILNDPDRVFIDIEPALISKELLTQKFEINEGFLQGIRVGQFSGSIGRIVLDFDKIKKFNIFSLNEPYRLVIDIYSDSHEPKSNMIAKAETKIEEEKTRSSTESKNENKEEMGPFRPASQKDTPAHPELGAENNEEKTPFNEEEKAKNEPEEEKIAKPNVNSDGTYSLARQLGLGLKRIVLDPGHGGKDPGAIGIDGIKEKDVVLSVSLDLADFLRQEGYTVYLTREKDVYLSLEERTAMANSLEADLFVSIHANSNRNRKLMGIETYYLNFAVSAEEMAVAARENATSQKSIGELQKLIKKIMLDSKIKESKDFAGVVHKQLVSAIKKRYSTNDLGIKKAPFYVLIGAQMPAVLLEISFVSNKIEAQRLSDTDYKSLVALAIKKGILMYGQDLGGQAYLRSSIP